MIKYWIKNRLFFSLIISIALGLLSLLVFIKPNMESHSYNIVLTSVYEKSEIDYDIPAPTKEQLNSIKDLDFIDDVFGYYFTDSMVKIGTKSKKAKILFSDMLDSLEFTMYNNSRMIESKEGLNNPIYVDYEFASNNELNLGDEIIFNNITFQIGRVYETNTYYGSALFAPLVGEQKVLIETNSKSYSGAFLKCNDLALADSYLRNYKPEGRLKDRSDFSSDEEYEMHYNSWNNANYYNEITSFASKKDALNMKSEIGYYMGAIISSIVMISLYIVLSFEKSEMAYFIKKEEKKSSKKYYIGSALFDFVLIEIISIVIIFIAKNSIKSFLPQNYIIPMLITYSVAAICMLLIELAFGILYWKKRILNYKK